MDCRGIAARSGTILKERLDVSLFEAVGPVAELAGHGDRPLLPKDLSYLIRSQGPQQAGHAAMTAATLELHGRTAEEPHVMSGKAAAKELFHRTAQQVLGAQLLDAPLRLLPDLAHLRVVGICFL